MRTALARVLVLLVALLLGVSASVLVACGAGPTRGIPATNADALNRDLDDVAGAVSAGKCEQAQAALAKARGEILNLPPSTSERLKTRLQEGASNLADRIPAECAKNATTSTPTDTTPTDTTTTDTTPTDTTTTDTTPTDTTTTDTTPTDTTTTDTTPTDTTPTSTTPTTTTPTNPTGGAGTTP